MMKAKKILAILLVCVLISADVMAIAEEVLDVLKLPSALKVIEEEAFYGNTSIEKVVVPEGASEIGSKAFANSSISEINLPESIEYIADNAFDGCEDVNITAKEDTYAYNWAVEKGYITPASTPNPDEFQMGDFTYTLSDGKATITGYVGNDVEVSVPDTIDSYPVTAIGESAFYNCDSIVNIEIPNSITSIGSLAFCACSSLANIEIPENVSYIGDYAFVSCVNLASITVLAGNEYYESEDGVLFDLGKTQLICFPAKHELTSYVIPDTVISVGCGAFDDCQNLLSIKIPDSVITIGDYAFEYCWGLTNIIIPYSVTTIGAYAFNDCVFLTSIVIPSSVTFIGVNAFEYCDDLIIYGESGSYAEDYAQENSIVFEEYGLTSVEDFIYEIEDDEVTITGYIGEATAVMIPSEIESFPVVAIGESAFEYNETIRSVVISEGVISIGDNAFSDCLELGFVSMPNSLEFIGSRVFSHSGNLLTIEIPANVSEMGYGPFTYCDNLVEITVSSENKYFKAIDGVLFDASGEILYAYPQGKEDTSYTIPEGVVTIDTEAFNFGIGHISDSEYESCGNLKHLVLPESLEEIDSCFFGCGFETIHIPKNVKCTTSNANPFEGCVELKSITVDPENEYFYAEDGLLFEYDYTYVYDEETETVTEVKGGCLRSYPEGKTDTKYTLPSSTIGIGDYVFSACCRLQEIVVPNSVQDIGIAFAGCENLKKISLPKTTYGGWWMHTFAYCTKLKNVNIPEGVESLYGTFTDCESLESVYIPASVTEITDDTFEGCPSYLNIYCEAGSYAETYAEENGITFYSTLMPNPEESISCTLKGRVVDSNNSALSGVSVLLYDFDETRLLGQTITDTDGVYIFDNLKQNTQYMLKAVSATLMFKQDEQLVNTEYKVTQVAAFKTNGFVHSNTQILYPGEDEKITLETEGLTITFTQSPYAERYVLSLRDLSDTSEDINGKLLYEHADASINGFNAGQLTGGHFYRVAVGAVPEGAKSTDSIVQWDETEFYVYSDSEPRVDGFTMSESRVLTGETVEFNVSAPNAVQVTLIVDGVQYNTAEVSDGIAVLERKFTLAGTRRVQFMATAANGVESAACVVQELVVEANGTLACPEIMPFDDVLLGTEAMVSWEPVENARHYTLRLWREGVETWNTVLDNDVTEKLIPASAFTEAGRYSIGVTASADGFSQSDGAFEFGVYTFASHKAWLQSECEAVYSDAHLTEQSTMLDYLHQVEIIDELGAAARIRFTDLYGNTNVEGYIDRNLLGETQYSVPAYLRVRYSRQNPKDPESIVYGLAWTSLDVTNVQMQLGDDMFEPIAEAEADSSNPLHQKFKIELPAVVDEAASFQVRAYSGDTIVETATLTVAALEIEEPKALTAPVIEDFVSIKESTQTDVTWEGCSLATSYLIEVKYGEATTHTGTETKCSTQIPASALARAGSYTITITAQAAGLASASATHSFTVEENGWYVWPNAESILYTYEHLSNEYTSQISFRTKLKVLGTEGYQYRVELMDNDNGVDEGLVSISSVGKSMIKPNKLPQFPGHSYDISSTYGTSQNDVHVKVCANLYTERAEIWENGQKLCDMNLISYPIYMSSSNAWFKQTLQLNEGQHTLEVRLYGFNGAVESKTTVVTIDHMHELDWSNTSTQIEYFYITQNQLTAKVVSGVCKNCSQTITNTYSSAEGAYNNALQLDGNTFRIVSALNMPNTELSFKGGPVVIENAVIVKNLTSAGKITVNASLTAETVSCGSSITANAAINAQNIACTSFFIDNGQTHADSIGCTDLYIRSNGSLLMQDGDEITASGKVEFSSAVSHDGLWTGGRLRIGGNLDVKSSNLIAGENHDTYFYGIPAGGHWIHNRGYSLKLGVVDVDSNLTNLHCQREFDFELLITPEFSTESVVVPQVSGFSKAYSKYDGYAFSNGSAVHSSVDAFKTSMTPKVKEDVYLAWKDKHGENYGFMVQKNLDKNLEKLFMLQIDSEILEGSRMKNMVRILALRALDEQPYHRGTRVENIIGYEYTLPMEYDGDYATEHADEMYKFEYQAVVTPKMNLLYGTQKIAILNVEYRERIVLPEEKASNWKVYENITLTPGFSQLNKAAEQLYISAQEVLKEEYMDTLEGLLNEYTKIAQDIVQTKEIKTALTLYNNCEEMEISDELPNCSINGLAGQCDVYKKTENLNKLLYCTYMLVE